MLPALSVARDESTCSPAGASQSKCQPRQACSPRGGSRTAALKVDPSSVETSTRSIGPYPDHARPVSVTGPGSTWRSRVMNSGTPGGAISDRGSMRVRGSPGVPSGSYMR